GWFGGGLGMYFGDQLNYGLIFVAGKMVGNLGDHPALAAIIAIVARSFGWCLLGIAIGASEGIAARSLGKFSYGTIGGLLGGFIGGLLFELFIYLSRQTDASTYLGNAVGLIILGACIGSLSALVQTVFLPANVKVMRGWQEG